MARSIKAISYRSIGDRSWLEAPASPSIKSHARRRGTECRVRRAPTQPRGISPMLKSVSNALILRGALAVIVGIVAIAWPGVTILALVILFAVYAFLDAGLQAVRGFSSATAGPVLGHLLLALIDLAAGESALV